MDVDAHIAALRSEGELMAATAAAIDPDADVPTCPEWRLRDLVKHTGGVHRWAAAHLTQRSMEPIAGFDSVVSAWPDDAGLIAWFREGHAALVDTLLAAGDDLACWSFLPAPSPRAFWARRQAHETGIHRVDAQSAAAGGITPFAAEFAVDGIEEMLFGFASRPGGGLRADPQRSLHLHATDTPGEWLVLAGPESMEVRLEHAKGDCAVRGTASDLHLLLWNRRAAAGLEVHGDAGVLDLWRNSVRVRWRR